MATQTQINTLTGLYVGYFDRSPDPDGLDFWIGQLDDGRDIRTIAQDFAKSKEAIFLYPYLTSPSSSSAQIFLATIYENLFNRAPDEAGLKFWSDVLGNGSVPVGDMIEAVLNGAVGDDATIVNNKIEVAYDWATSVLRKSDFIYDEDAASAAKAAIANVTETAASVIAAKEQTDAYVAGTTEEPAPEPMPAPGGGGTPAPAPEGKTFILTTEDDAVVGTAGDDTFVGVQSGIREENTFSASDDIDGLGGSNTLQLQNRTDAEVHAATVSNVSNMIYISSHVDGGDLDLTNFASVTDLTLKHTVGFSDVAGVTPADSLTIIDSHNTMDTTVTYTEVGGATDAAIIALNGVQGGSDLQLSGAIETVTLATSGSASALADLDLDAATTTLNIAADENLTIEDHFTATGLTKLAVSGDSIVRIKPTLDAATVAVDATAMTAGGLKVKLGGGDVKVTGGSGKDVVDMGAGLTADDELAGGAHDEDTLAVSGPVTADDVSQVTGFEYLSFTANVTQDVNLVSAAGFRGFISRGNADATFNNVNNDMLIVAEEKASGTINVTPTANAGTEVLSIWLWNSDLTALTASGFETVNLSSYGNSGGTATHVISTLNIDAGAKVVLDGGTDLTITDALAAPATIDASSGFIGKLSIVGSTGADVIKGGTAADTITVGAGADVVTGGAGNDKIDLGGADSATDKIIFEGTAAGNGADSISGFTVGGTGDLIDFTSFLGANVVAYNGVLTANPAGSESVEGDVTVLLDIDGGQDIMTAAGLATAIDAGGEYANLDMAANGKSVILTSATAGGTAAPVNAFYATSDASGMISVELVGTFTSSDIGGLHANNFI